MDKFTKITGVAAPMPLMNIDTDMIIPKQFLKTIKRSGLGVNLFDEMRYTADGAEIEDFVLNQPAYRDAQIIVAGDNFGCGSSREHAPWALLDFGIRVIVSTRTSPGPRLQAISMASIKDGGPARAIWIVSASSRRTHPARFKRRPR